MADNGNCAILVVNPLLHTSTFGHFTYQIFLNIMDNILGANFPFFIIFSKEP